MKRVLFLSINYAIEGIEHGKGVLNGFTAFSEMLVNALSEYAVVDVVTDYPERFPRNRTLNIFRSTGSRATDFEEFWRREYRVSGAPTAGEFSRDTLYRLFQLANALDPDALDDLLGNGLYDVVVLNRHEYFFLSRHPALATKQTVFCAHDSNYLRKLSYEENYGTAQPLTHIEKALEHALVPEADKLISISVAEKAYFESIVGDGRVVLFRPVVTKPERLVSLDSGKGINFYFIGVNNFVNRQTLESALKMFAGIRREGLDRFHVFGSVCRAISGDFPMQDVLLHGHVDDLEGAMSDMHVLLAPISSGSGIPIKISDALNAGHLVLASQFGAASYEEFLGSRIILGERPDVSLIQALCSAQKTLEPYDRYAEKNRQAAHEIVGGE